MRRTQNQAARLGGGLFIISGALVLLNNYAPASDHLDRELLAYVGGGAIAVGLAAWYFPWERLPRFATLVLPVFGLSLIGVANALGGVSAQSYSAFFILIAAYIGASQPRWTTTAFALPMTVVYMSALSYRPDATPAAVWSATIVIPVCVLVGELIASSLDRLARARAHSERRAELLAVTAAAARTVSALDPKAVLRAVADAAVALGYDGVTVEVFDRRGARYHCAEARGLPDGFSGKVQDASRGITGEVRRSRAQVILDGYDRDSRALPTLRGLGFQVVIGTPIWKEAKLVAVLNAGSKRPIAIEESELEALELLSEQAGRALQLADDYVQQGRERRRYRRESLEDELTGLGNRRRAEQLLSAARTGDVVAMLDLDDFKAINTTFGHAEGDSILAAFGEHLRSSLRGGDSAARLGGEEFLVLLRRPGLEMGDALERLRTEWIATKPGTTFSTGSAILRKREAPQEALARADAALSRAKAAGKNCVRHADITFSVEASKAAGAGRG